MRLNYDNVGVTVEILSLCARCSFFLLLTIINRDVHSENVVPSNLYSTIFEEISGEDSGAFSRIADDEKLGQTGIQEENGKVAKERKKRIPNKRKAVHQSNV